MIASLNGKLIYVDAAYIVVECGGVGFKCFVTKNTFAALPPVDNDIFLHTYMSVREDAMDLYAFSTIAELEAFKLITSVNGVGAKIGIAILSEFTSNNVISAIAAGDAKILTAASGVGIKLAQRIVLELKDKVGSVFCDDDNLTVLSSSNVSNTNAKEAVEALIALGYPKSAAANEVSKLDGSLPAATLIKQALKGLSRR